MKKLKINHFIIAERAIQHECLMLFKHRLRFPVIATLSWKEVGKNGVKVRVCVVDKDFSGLAINQ